MYPIYTALWSNVEIQPTAHLQPFYSLKYCTHILLFWVNGSSRQLTGKPMHIKTGESNGTTLPKTPELNPNLKSLDQHWIPKHKKLQGVKFQNLNVNTKED